MDGEKETIIMGAAEVICCFFLEEKIHNRPEISDHFHTHVPERSVKHANENKGQGIRANSGKSEVRYDYYDVYNRLQFVHTHCS